MRALKRYFCAFSRPHAVVHFGTLSYPLLSLMPLHSCTLSYPFSLSHALVFQVDKWTPRWWGHLNLACYNQSCTLFLSAALMPLLHCTLLCSHTFQCPCTLLYLLHPLMPFALSHALTLLHPLMPLHSCTF